MLGRSLALLGFERAQLGLGQAQLGEEGIVPCYSAITKELVWRLPTVLILKFDFAQGKKHWALGE